MIRVSQLSYITAEVENPGAVDTFAKQLAGLETRRGTDGCLLMRNDEKSYRLRVLPGAKNDLLALGWALPDGCGMDEFEAQIRAAGWTASRGTKEAAHERMVLQLLEVTDPNGIRCEIVQGLKVEPVASFQAAVPHHGFVTGEEGMGHCAIWVDDIDATVAFYCNALGMRVSDWARSEHMTVAFLRCNKRQHSLALIQAPAPGSPTKRLHHIFMEARDLDDVGSAYDRAQAENIVVATLGKHPADGAVSFYMQTPAGFAWEIGWGGLHIDNDDTWQVTWHDSHATWGHEFLGLMETR